MRAAGWQGYIQRQQVGTEAYALFKQLDLGDIVGFTGRLFRTKTNELTLSVAELVLLTKAVLPLPEKFHGSPTWKPVIGSAMWT